MKFYTKQSFILSFLFLTFFVSQLKAQKLGAETSSQSSYVITSGGSLYTFGYNSNGQLGIGSTTQQNTPQIVSFPSGVISWTAIAGGYQHSLAIGNDGNLYSWGYNGDGELGIGSTTDQSTPQKVTFPSGVTSWTAIAAGFEHSLAIGNDGNLYSWGYNGDGELGIGNTTNQSTPQKVTFPIGVTSWTAIAAGYSHSLAIGNDGNLYSWGLNDYGQLGINSITNQSTPQKVTFPSGVTIWTAIAAGDIHSLAIGNNGNLYSWGSNYNGQLGIGSTTDQSTPQIVSFPSGVTSWTAIAAGYIHSLAIGNDGNLYSWGYNFNGQLGIGSTTQQTTPQKVTFPSGVTSWTAIAAGDSHSLAIGNDGNLYSWGDNGWGELGIGSTNDQSSPTVVLLNSPLPVELTTFTAASTSSAAVELKWNTATELNNYGFEIQRSEVGDQKSIDNLQWTKIGFVKGSGNSKSPKNYSFVDDNPVSGTINYRLKQVDYDGNFKYSSVVTVSSIPSKFGLSQNYPNPFNPTTAISYQLSASSHVTLKIYDELGREVTTLVNENKQAGDYKVTFNGSNLASGIYYYRITAGSFNAVRKLILLK